MSGVTGSDRVSRTQFDTILSHYKREVLSKIPGFVSVETSGSYNSDMSKTDFGDMDLIVHFKTSMTKGELKKSLMQYFLSLPDSIIIPFQSEKYKGKKAYNSGEIVSINYPQGDGKTVQIDNIIALDEIEVQFKKSFLDLPAEKQGLILGLVKIAMMEDNAETLIKKLSIPHIKLKDGEEYEFNLSSSFLQLRAVTNATIDGKIKQVDKRVLWSTQNWDFVSKLLNKYNLNDSFEGLVQQAERIVKNKRGLNRIVGIFKSMITVKSGEVGTPKGFNKEKAIERIEQLLGERKVIGFKKYLNEREHSVGIFVGRFQPLTKAHTDIINLIATENDKGIIYIVKGKNTSADKKTNPFDIDIQKKLLEAVIPSNITIEILPSAFFVDELNKLDDIIFNVYAGTDRVAGYKKFSQYMEDGRILNVREIKRSDEDISATKVRLSIIEDDYDTFKTLTDVRIHKYYDELKQYMDNQND